MAVVSDNKAPPLSILIISWNSWPDLHKCLDSLYASTFRHREIVIIDNASADGTLDALRNHFPEVTVHANDRNVGHARAVNQGIRVCRGEFVLLLDADTEFPPESIGRLMEFMQTRRDVALAAPRTYNTDGSVQESARNLPSFMSGLFGRQSLLTRLFPENPFSRRYLARDKLKLTVPYPVKQVSSACMIFPRALFDEIGPWDENYFAYWVDTDWCVRLGKHGKHIYCIPDASVIHHEGNHRGKKKTARRIWLFHRGAWLLYRKHYTLGLLDPRAIAAWLLLATRAILLIAGSVLRTDHTRSAASPAAGLRGRG